MRLHGTGYWFFRNRTLEAADRLHQRGQGRIAINKDKLFYSSLPGSMAAGKLRGHDSKVQVGGPIVILLSQALIYRILGGNSEW